MNHGGRHRFFWFALAGGLWLVLVYLGAMWSVLERPVIAERSPLSFGHRNDGWFIAGVDPRRAAAVMLKRGDQVLAIDGDRRARKIGPEPFIRFLGPGSEVEFTVLRDGEERNVRLKISADPAGTALGHVASFFLVSLSFFLMAVLMGLMRPEDPLIRLGCVAGLWIAWRMLAFALLPFRLGSTGVQGTLRDLEPALELGVLALGFHFFHRLSGIRGERIWPFLQVLFYTVCGAISILDLTMGLFRIQGRERAIALFDRYPIHAWRPMVASPLRPYLFIPLAMCVVIVRGYLKQRDPAHRRRLRWVVVGLLAGVGPLVLQNVAGFLRLRFPLSTPQSNAFIVLIPITLAYAVVKHQVLGLRVVIRQGVKYLLARNVLYAILVLPVAALVLPFVRHPEMSVGEITRQNPVYLNLALVAALSAGLMYRRQLQSWVDRRFFREVYNQELILRRLIERVAATHSLAEISRIVSDEVDAALHPRSVHIYYRERASSGLTLGHSSTGSAGPRMPDDSGLVAVLERTRKAVEYPSAGIESEGQWLEGLTARLIVPIVGSRPPLAGLLLLGEKKSEEPYSPTDKTLLQSLAGQMALVSENVWLQERLDEEGRIRHDVLAHLDRGDVNLLRECPRCGTCYDSNVAVCSVDGSELTFTLPVERVIEGKYRLDSRLGRGGMGAVYAATDLRLNRGVAVKVMIGSLFGNRAALRRFEREARATAQLVHPNIVAIHDYGRAGSDGAYLVMERVPGCTWRSELGRRRRLTPETAAQWFDQLLSGLEAAHRAGIVHRDLKPDNVLVDRDRLKVLDFGLAKMRGPEEGETHSVTMPGTVLGTLGYMAPEQLMGKESDERSDLFSAGVMAVEALTGRRQFSGRDYGEVLAAMLREEFELPGAPHGLIMVLRKCLAADPEARYQKAAEMRRDLVAALRTCPPLAVRPGPGDPDAGPTETRSMGAP